MPLATNSDLATSVAMASNLLAMASTVRSFLVGEDAVSAWISFQRDFQIQRSCTDHYVKVPVPSPPHVVTHYHTQWNTVVDPQYDTRLKS